MAYRFHIDSERRLAYIALKGATSGADLLAATTELYESPEWTPGTNVVWDFLRMGALDLTPEHLDALIAVDRANASIAAGGRDVLVVGQDELYGLGRLFSLLAETSPRDASVCRSLAEARALLGVDRLPGET